ncbi:MAG TPA: carboxypeptidase-like regulatory domain-containing protein, partial [Terriglobia bacterium]|nr:carboxypeptidase-like regulatory domain-containing protein [Terriglobia bacterium]
MAAKNPRLWMCSFLVALLLPTLGMAQSFTGTLSGTVTDPTGAVIPNAIVTLTDVATETSAASVSTGRDGLYSFPNLRPGSYELKVSAAGFRDYVQRGITVAIEQRVRADVSLELGVALQTIEVSAAASPLNFETAEVASGISPNTLKELPLLVAGTVRSAASFAILMPGVTTGGGGNPFDARINGGLQTGDEAVMDGASMQQGMMNQTGMISIYSDFPMTPDMVSELKV